MKIRKRTILKTIAAVYVAAVIIAAVVLGVVGANRVAASCNTTRIDDEMYGYWQAQLRYRYVVQHAEESARDTDLYWSLPASDQSGRTNGEAVEELTREYVEYVLAASYLFDSLGYRLEDSDREPTEEYLAEKVRVGFGGDKKEYNRAAEKYGFSLRAAEDAELMVKKMQLLRQYTVADIKQQDAYYKDSYVRVKLAYILNSDPDYEIKCETLRRALAESPQEGEEDPFTELVKDAFYNADTTARANPDGYYFAPASSFTQATMEGLEGVVKEIFAIQEENGTATYTIEVTLSDDTTETRTYFIKRYALEYLAYGEEDNEAFFSDFVSLATDHYFFAWCDTARQDIVWKDENCPAWVAKGSSGSEGWYKFF